MADQADWEKKFQEDLERAQALSLESLALEKFRKDKALQDKLKNVNIPKTTSIQRSSSMSESDGNFITDKPGNQPPKPRPRPGASIISQTNALIAPPPSNRKLSCPTGKDMPDLISFCNPPSKTENLLEFCNTQYNNNTPGFPQYAYRPIMPNLNLPTFQSQQYLYRPFVGNGSFIGSYSSYSSQNVSPSSGVPINSPFINASNLSTSSSNATQEPPKLPPKNQYKNPPPLTLPSSSTRRDKKENSLNLIDFAQDQEDKNSVRVSILQEFDPILSSNDYSNQSRTISPEYPDDSASVCDSVYDEYDPYDFINTVSGNNSISDPIYATVNKAESVSSYSSPVKSTHSCMSTLDRRNSRYNSKVKKNLLENIVQMNTKCNDAEMDLVAFFNMVQNVRNKYKYNDPDTNMGFVISPMVNYQYKEGTSIKLCVHPDFEGADFDKPFIFTCDVTSSIEHITLQLTCDLEAPSNVNYTLKVWGYNEYFAPASLLSDYEYVHSCIKLEEDVLLILIPDSKVNKTFARTQFDDNRDRNLSYEDIIPSNQNLHINYDSLKIVLEFLEAEIQKLEEEALRMVRCENPSILPNLQPNKVVQSVKYVINLMSSLCTVDIMEAVDNLIQTCNSLNPKKETGDYAKVPLSTQIVNCCNKVKIAVLNLIDMYSNAFEVDFCIKNSIILNEPIKEIGDVLSPLVVRISALYKPNVDWTHDFYIAAAQIYHGTKPIKKCIPSLPCVKSEDHSWPSRIVFEHWITFDEVPINSLARESRLVIVIYGRTEEPSDNNDSESVRYKQEEIGWAAIQLFDYEGLMVQGSMLLSIWPKDANYKYGPAPSDNSNCNPDHALLSLDINSPCRVKFPQLKSDAVRIVKGEFNSLDQQTQEQLLDISEMDMLEKVPAEIREVLWEKRHYLYHIPECLPKVLLAAHSWEYSCLADLHGMLHSWKPLRPIQALQLLLPTFPDMEVRKYAIKWLGTINTDALIDYLPQLVVAVKFETYETSALAEFLLDRALRSPRFAHYLFWLLSNGLPGALPQNFTINSNDKEAMYSKEARHYQRTKLLLRALMAICGESLRNCFLSQQLLVKDLNDIAESVQKTKDSHRQTTLQQALQSVDNNLRDAETSLPLALTQRVAGVHIHSCSYFTSNTFPLKINFLAPDRSIIPAIYKLSDDLQQDMLTLQMVRIMDKMWLNKGLDLKMVAFGCISTGKKRGMIELVKNAETLRKIQVEHGLTGSFKDKPIAEWLAKHNPSELEYGRAVENFTASCAGYCVATYILGICDRHNDNIMLKTSGHLFHIDFGKFLGDAQMFGNFKRDRVPFVLTSDMAYVINGGDKPSEKFHQFVDLCCQAFNIVRSNRHIILYIFTLMMYSGMCGVTSESVSYLHNALLPRMSNPEAAAYFARMIESSLKSWFTQFNFFLHNLAQLKFSTDQKDGSLLSFVPKTYTMETDGQLKHVEVVNYKKRYDPDKYYVYVLRVYREDNGPPMEIQRTYKEFCELHQKLCIYFPLAKLHSLSSGLHVGRSNIKQVAEKRFHEVCLFIKSLFLCAKEIAHSELVYTFFHPLLRDQQCQEDYYKKNKDKGVNYKKESGRLKGQLKLSMQFSKGVFSVMVQHVRGLALLPNGQEPSTYVKVYLQPDVSKATKRKTKVVKRNCHPSFMEMLEYRMNLDTVMQRHLKATVWNYDPLQENEFLGGVDLDLSQFDLTQEITEWYPLGNLSR